MGSGNRTVTPAVINEGLGYSLRIPLNKEHDSVLNQLNVPHGWMTPYFIGVGYPKEDEIERAKNQCNLIWLENLSLRRSYKAVIMDYIKEKYPALLPLYQDIYNRGNRSYWEALGTELKEYAAETGLDYVTNDDSMSRPFDAPPVIVNYFYHSEIKKSAKKGGGDNA